MCLNQDIKYSVGFYYVFSLLSIKILYDGSHLVCYCLRTIANRLLAIVYPLHVQNLPTVVCKLYKAHNNY